ncbi:MAG: hypothetical protein HQ541_12725 [Mariniphaga sp.]|nr:hypothetical protein [Mariniphaga sp.]
MQKQLSKSARQTWITINFVSILLIVFFFYLGRSLEKPPVFFIGGTLAAVLTIISFIKVFIQTGLWKMVHKTNTLDERQMQVLLNALKYSYSVFVIFSLLIIYGFAVVNKEPINVLIAACLLYLAHILPAAIVGWKEKVV